MPRPLTRAWTVRLVALAGLCLAGTAPCASAQTVRLQWDAPPGGRPTRYVVQWGQESGVYGNMAEVDGAQTTYMPADLTAGETLYFVVRAIDARGSTSSPSNELSVHVPTAVTPVAAALEPVPVADEPGLQNAVRAARPGTRLLLAPGTYRLAQSLRLPDGLERVHITSASGRAEDVVLVGPPGGEGVAVPALYIGPGAGITVEAVTIQDTAGPAIDVSGQAREFVLRQVRIVGAGGFVRASGGPEGRAEGGRLEDCTFEYAPGAAAARAGLDLRAVDGWLVAGNRVLGVSGEEFGGSVAVLRITGGSRGTTVERNVFVRAAGEIEVGEADPQADAVTGTIIRNNMVSRAGAAGGRGVAIALLNAPDSTVAHNTVVLDGTGPGAIEYAHPLTQGVLVANNLVDGTIDGRDAASARLERNERIRTVAMFVSAAAGDLRLVRSQSDAVIDRGTFVPVVPNDIDGRPRPIGLATDIGAHEVPPL